jgi:mannose-1-phosphate guanylyltransferase
MARPLVAVLLAGGAGTRFWPLSTEGRPKQFLPLLGRRSLLQQSYDRVADLVGPERTLALTSEAYVDLVAEQIPALPRSHIVGEPLRRDTAAAVALATLLVKRLFGPATVAVLTADHRIEPVSTFQRELLSAVRGAEETGCLYTFGIPPGYPATAYGYLHCEEKVADDGGVEHYRISSFKEKPDRDTARRYVESGQYYWNSGMFVWTTEAIETELRRHLPGHLEALEPAVARLGTADWPGALRQALEPLPRVSIDYGVMEKAAQVRMVKATFDWSDLGGWLALEPYLSRDGRGNSHNGRLAVLEADNNLVFSEDPEEVVALLGVEDLVVLRSGKATLVAPRHRLEEIKRLVEQMKEER